LTNNASIEVLFPQMRPEKKQVQVELEDDENGLFLYCKLMRTKWNLNKIELSGKKMGQSHENLSF
jgi:lysyl-tRNA synthetase class 2